MDQDPILGFIVVRKPGHTDWSKRRGLAQAGGKPYSGIMRLPWEDLFLAYYDRRLPPHLRQIWEALKRSARDLTGIQVLKSYAQAATIQRTWPDNDVIAIKSPELTRIKGEIEPGIELKALGFDCIAFGEWSVLADGLHYYPEQFGEQVDWLNERGLLTSEEECDAVFSRYVELSRQNVTEPLADDAVPLAIQVFDVVPPA